jgi:murein DD-endopeptidase MepM/ murein hydrolase activator NlpD
VVRLRVALVILLVVITSIVSYRIGKQSASPIPVIESQPIEPGTLPIPPSPSPFVDESSVPEETPVATPAASSSSSPSTEDANFVGRLKLIIPVAGVRADQLIDTFSAARAEGRTHDAIDIPAAAGTPVLAATEGEIVRLFQSDRGGTTIYQLSPDKKLVFYYAHLQAYADGIVAGKYVHQGEVIAYVGDTGNAGPGNFHLHFSIAILADPKRYWDGTNINPYPILRH